MPRVTFLIGVATGAFYIEYADSYLATLVIVFTGVVLALAVIKYDEKRREKKQ